MSANQVREAIEIEVSRGQGQRLNPSLADVSSDSVQGRDARDAREAQSDQSGITDANSGPLHGLLCLTNLARRVAGLL
jgi:hypothetical protein